jgi:hypothetical protein
MPHLSPTMKEHDFFILWRLGKQCLCFKNLQQSSRVSTSECKVMINTQMNLHALGMVFHLDGDVQHLHNMLEISCTPFE